MEGFLDEHVAFVETPRACQRVFVFPALLIFLVVLGVERRILAENANACQYFFEISGAEPVNR
jgi:hypothetical protein